MKLCGLARCEWALCSHAYLSGEISVGGDGLPNWSVDTDHVSSHVVPRRCGRDQGRVGVMSGDGVPVGIPLLQCDLEEVVLRTASRSRGGGRGFHVSTVSLDGGSWRG